MTTGNRLSEAIFKTVISNAPLFSIDIVVINENDEVLVGKRLNAPAKGWWFVPGGRVYKNESLDKAFQRISETELGTSYTFKQADFLGLYEHFYDDCVFGSATSTHYINAAYALNINLNDLHLPMGEQHLNYRWVSIPKFENDSEIHHFSKVFWGDLIEVHKPLK